MSRRLALVSLLTVAALAGCSDSTDSTASPASAAPSAAASSADAGGGGAVESLKGGDIGKPVRDEKFEYTVKSVECSVKPPNMEPQEIDSTPDKGKFCVVSYSLQSFSGTATFQMSNQSAYDTKGVKYPYSNKIRVKNQFGSVFAAEGTVYNDYVIFDIPADATLAKLEYHAEESKKTATIKLG